MLNINGNGNKILVFDSQKNDYVDLDKNVKGIDVFIYGDNNLVKFKDISFIKHLYIQITQDNNVLSIGKSLNLPYPATINSTFIYIGGGGCIGTIGDHPVMQAGVMISCIEPNAKFQIGDNARIAGDTKIFAADAHPIIDISTGKVINYGHGQRILKIGNNCWIGEGAFISKNTNLPDYTIVGARSFVSGCFDEMYTIIAGIPAKIIKKNVKRLDRWCEVDLGD